LVSNELVDRPIVTPDVQFVLDVFPKSQDAEATAQEERTLPDPWSDLRQSKDFPTTQVGVEIHPDQRWQVCATIDIAANDGTTPSAVGVYRHWAFEPWGLTIARWIETGLPLHETPAVVPSSRRPGRGEVHLFPTVLANVGNIEIASRRIERKTPGIAQPFGPDGAQWCASGGHGIIRRDGVKRRRGPGLKTRIEA